MENPRLQVVVRFIVGYADGMTGKRSFVDMECESRPEVEAETELALAGIPVKGTEDDDREGKKPPQQMPDPVEEPEREERHPDAGGRMGPDMGG